MVVVWMVRLLAFWSQTTARISSMVGSGFTLSKRFTIAIRKTNYLVMIGHQVLWSLNTGKVCPHSQLPVDQAKTRKINFPRLPIEKDLTRTLTWTHLYTSALFQASNCFSLMVSFSSSGAMYLLVPTLLLNGMSTSSWSVSFTQRPRSAMTQVRSFFTRMFRDFRSRWAIAGLPCVPDISRWRCVSPLAMSRAMLTHVSGDTVCLLR